MLLEVLQSKRIGQVNGWNQKSWAAMSGDVELVLIHTPNVWAVIKKKQTLTRSAVAILIPEHSVTEPACGLTIISLFFVRTRMLLLTIETYVFDAPSHLNIVAKRYTTATSTHNVRGLTLVFAHCIGSRTCFVPLFKAF